MFVNNLVLRTEVIPAESFADLLGRVREVDLDAFAHSTVPFETVVEVLDPARSRARNPLFQVALAFQNLDHTPLTLPGLRVSAMTPPTRSARFDLQLTVTADPDPSTERTRRAAVFTYATDLFDHHTVADIGERFIRMLSEAVAQPDTSVGDLALLDPDPESPPPRRPPARLSSICSSGRSPVHLTRPHSSPEIVRSPTVNSTST